MFNDQKTPFVAGTSSKDWSVCTPGVCEIVEALDVR